MVKVVMDNVFFYVFGLIVMDIFLGYDYIMVVIGGVIVVFNGVDFFCYVIFVEYFGFLDVEYVR